MTTAIRLPGGQRGWRRAASSKMKPQLWGQVQNQGKIICDVHIFLNFELRMPEMAFRGGRKMSLWFQNYLFRTSAYAVLLGVRCIASGQSFLEGAALPGIDINVRFFIDEVIDWLMSTWWFFGRFEWCECVFFLIRL